MNFLSLPIRRNSLSGLENCINLENLRIKALRKPGEEDIAVFKYWISMLDSGQRQMAYRAGIMLNWLIGYYGAREFDTTIFEEMCDSRVNQV